MEDWLCFSRNDATQTDETLTTICFKKQPNSTSCRRGVLLLRD